MINTTQKNDKLCSKCGRKEHDIVLEPNGICSFCNSIGTPCGGCSRKDRSLHPNGLCDWCLHKKNFPDRYKSVNETTTNVWDILKIILSVLFLVFLIWWIYIQVQGNRSNSSETSECGYGYHLEGYTTSYGETVTECFKD